MIKRLLILLLGLFLPLGIYAQAYVVPNFTNERPSGRFNNGSREYVGNISAKYAFKSDIERYDDEALSFVFSSNGGVTKYTYKRDNYDRILDWNATCTYGNYTITERTEERAYITVTWSNGRQEKYYIDYSNSHYTTLHEVKNSTVTKWYKEVL